MKKFALSTLAALTIALGWSAPPATADAPLVTITGTVVSNTDGVLTLSTDKGNLRFDLDKDTVMPANIAVGNRITVWYDSDDKTTDKMDARKIEMAPATATPSTTTPTPVTQTTPSTPAPEQTQPESTELPRTASPFPLVACLGVLALAGAFLLRSRREA